MENPGCVVLSELKGRAQQQQPPLIAGMLLVAELQGTQKENGVQVESK